LTKSGFFHIIPRYFVKKSSMTQIKKFLREVKQEVKKVAWPKKEDTLRYSVMVIIASLVVAAYLGGIDYLVTTLLERFI